MRVAVTGHQPHALGGYGEDVSARLVALARGWIDANRPSEVISGMAAGWDMAVAEAAVAAGVPLVAALAYPGQGQSWPDGARERLTGLLAAAAMVHVMPGGPGMWTKRDGWVLARGERVLALWNGEDGGTARAVQKAGRLGRPVENLWDRWSGVRAAA